jgi:transcriptional regulator with XRE-family HTH domain
MSEETGERLADKLNHLFATVRTPGGQEYSNEQVAAAIGRRGVSISQSYIWQLRKQKKTNPTLKHLQALADFFGVPAAYFFDDEVTRRVEGQLEARAVEQAAEQAHQAEQADKSEIRLMAMRAGELSPSRRRQVMELIDVVYRLEQAERQSGGDG